MTRSEGKAKNAMTFVGKANCVQANLRFTLLSQQIENTLYFEYKAGSVTPALMNTLGDDLITWWVANIAPEVTTDMTFREVYLTDLTTQTSPTVTATTGLPSAGTLSGDPVPNNVALCVSFRSSGRGRSSRGRNYISGIPEGYVSGNDIDTTLADALVLAYEGLQDAATFTDDWTWIVYSRFQNGDPRPEALIAPVDAVVLTDYVVDSQRRRLPGRGR
jgi:hypothetical protein